MNIYALYMDENIDSRIFNFFSQHISIEKLGKIKNLKKIEDKKRSILADILVRSVLINDYKFNNNQIEFLTNKYGKPYLVNNKEIEFNISHSSDWIVCAIDNKPLGIDIEKKNDIDLYIAEQFFSEFEYKSLLEKHDTDKIDYFYSLWTLKESYVKACGMGLNMDLASFSIVIMDERNIALLTDKINKKFYFKQYDIDSNYKFSVCSLNNNFPKEIILKDLTCLYHIFNK